MKLQVGRCGPFGVVGIEFETFDYSNKLGRISLKQEFLSKTMEKLQIGIKRIAGKWEKGKRNTGNQYD